MSRDCSWFTACSKPLQMWHGGEAFVTMRVKAGARYKKWGALPALPAGVRAEDVAKVEPLMCMMLKAGVEANMTSATTR